MRSSAYIAAAWRTPFARAGTVLADVSAQDLATAVVKPAPSMVPALPGLADVILGNVLNGRGNLARYAALAADLGIGVPGVTVDRQCASGMEAIMQAAYRAERSASPISFVAGGVESMSGAPFLMARPARAYDRKPPAFIDVPLSPPSIGDPSMIETAEIVSAEAGITREEMDSYALSSHRRAIAARARNNGSADIVAVRSPSGELVAEDVGPRTDSSPDKLARLAPVMPKGTVTAGNASQITDGAAAVVVMNDAALAESGARPLARIAGATCVGVDPSRMGLGPVFAIRALSAEHKLALADIDDWEINEAFAGQVLAVLRALGLSPDAVNPDGGAVALGHPLGASGARITGDLARRLAKAGPGARGIASLCIGGGMGMAVLLESAA
jgi:acetyl-CoA acetyltransferase family protein